MVLVTSNLYIYQHEGFTEARQDHAAFLLLEHDFWLNFHIECLAQHTAIMSFKFSATKHPKMPVKSGLMSMSYVCTPYCPLGLFGIRYPMTGVPWLNVAEGRLRPLKATYQS